jgi:hypothetical protein
VTEFGKEVLSEEWKDRMSEGVKNTLDNYELFERINFAPLSLIEDFDDRRWDQLSKEERDWVTSEIFFRYGFNRRNEIVVAEYEFDAPKEKGVTWKGTAKVKVYETHRSKLENMYLHEITRPGAEVEYMIAPKDARL